MCLGVDAPPARNVGAETAQTLQSEIDLAPQQYNAEATYSPLYASLARKNFQDNLLGTPARSGLLGQQVPAQRGLLDILEKDYAPAMNRIDDAASASAVARQRAGDMTQRAGDISDVERLGTRAVNAIKAANPEQAALMKMLNSQATGELAQGANLDPSMAREVAQSVRAGQSARGMGFGNNDVAQEALFTGMQAEQLRQQRRAFATQIAGLNAATTQDPFLAILGRPSNQTNAGALLGAQGFVGTNQNLGAGAQPNLFNPQSPYAQDVYNTNYNGQAAAKIAEANNYAQLYGSAIKAGGSIIGGAAAGCWVAREVFGPGNPQWMQFKAWLLTAAPGWFRRAYLQYGERFAAFIRNKPTLKRMIRRWMLARIQNKGEKVYAL